MLDGARNALLGYLYQFLVVSSLRVWADAAADDSPSDHPLRTLLVKGRLASEMFNQDGVITPDAATSAECAAVQVKHSNTGDEIDLQAFTEVLCGFDQSRLQALKEAQTVVGNYWVVTNRPRHPDVEQLWSTNDTTGLTKLLNRNRGKAGEPKWLRALLGKYATKDTAYTAWGEVLTRLQPVVPIRPEVSAERLRTHLRSHGVLAGEIETAIKQLLGALVVGTADGMRVELSRAYLNLHLIGAEDARPATLEAAGGMAAAARVRVTEQLSNCSRNFPVRRGLMQSLREQVERYPVTVVYGDGGCGKSVLALQHLLGAGGVGVSVHACEASERHLTSQLRRLRSETQYHQLPDDALDTAIERLRTANPTATTVLLVDIDAVDELRQQDRGEVHELIRRWVSGRLAGSAAKLVVSCRPEQAGERGLQLALRTLTGMPYDLATAQVGTVYVGDFSEDELIEAARMLAGGAERRLLASGVFSSPEGAVFEAGVQPVSPQIADSLRHPVVWGAYATLNPVEREGVLNGLPNGTARLAGALVDRFLDKCVNRGSLGLEITRLEEALRRVARAAPHPRFVQQEIWVTGCADLIGGPAATMLYREALTYGLIVEDGSFLWRWRHPFLAPYLLGTTHER